MGGLFSNIGLRKTGSLLASGFGLMAGKGLLGALLNYFARYFRTAQIYGAIDGVNYLLDTVNDQTRVTAPCNVWVADGTATLDTVMAEKSYTAACKAVTTNGVVVTLTIAYSATKYVIQSAAQNIARIKIYDPIYTPTDAEVLELDLNGTQSWVAHHFPMEEGTGVICFDVINAGVYGTLTGVAGTYRGTDKTIYSRNDALGYSEYDSWQVETGTAQVIEESGENVIEQVTDGVTSIPCTQAYGTWEFDFNKGGGVNTSIYELISSVNIGVGDKYKIFSDSTENIRFFRNDNVGTSADLFTTVNSYLSINIDYRIKIERNFTVNQFHTGAKGSFRALIKGGSFGSTYVLIDVSGGSGTNPTTDDTYTESSYFVTDMDAGDKFGNPVLSNAEIPILPVLGVRESLIPILSSRHDLTVLSTTPDFTGEAGKHFQLVDANCLVGDGIAKLTFASLPTYDAITILEDGVEAVITLTALEYVMTNLSKYSLVIFKNIGVEVGKFRLEEFDNELTIAALNFNDVIGSATCSLSSGGSGNVSKQDLMSLNWEKGFATIDANDTLYPRLEDESGYAGLTGGEAGFTEHLPATDGDSGLSSKTYSEQKILAIESKEWIVRDDKFINASAVDKPFFTAGVANEISLREDVNTGGDTVDVTLDANDNIRDIKLSEL